MSPSKLQMWFAWTKSPVIINGPMIGAACPRLATEVTKAGGLGFIASTVNLTAGSPDLKKLDADLQESRTLQGDSSNPLKVGASFVTGHASVTLFKETALPILSKHRPAAVWLFAPDGDVKPHRSIINAIKTLDQPPRIFVQVGNVAAAREAAEDGADVIVTQGVDAGGHQFRRGTGIISFVPEVRNMLEQEFQGREIGLVAAGGIADGRGVAAALALGAEGVVMGTRFTVAEESIFPQFRKDIVLSTSDGGVSTLKSPFCDQINENKLWGPLYDGRAIVGPIHEKFLAGATLEECLTNLKENYSEAESIKMCRTWAGAGVGLVKRAQPAGEIVREVREQAKGTIQRLASHL
ncbi:Fc.00g100330.m01.CDS01 [Cosmosporella sp. VM-42]